MYNKPDCVDCRKLKEIYGKTPDCQNCIPELFEENQDAIRIWGFIGDQRIYAGMDGICVGLMHEPVWRLIDEFNVVDRIGTFQKVLKIYDFAKTIEKELSSKGNSNG